MNPLLWSCILTAPFVTPLRRRLSLSSNLRSPPWEEGRAQQSHPYSAQDEIKLLPTRCCFLPPPCNPPVYRRLSPLRPAPIFKPTCPHRGSVRCLFHLSPCVSPFALNLTAETQIWVEAEHVCRVSLELWERERVVQYLSVKLRDAVPKLKNVGFWFMTVNVQHVRRHTDKRKE